MNPPVANRSPTLLAGVVCLLSVLAVVFVASHVGLVVAILVLFLLKKLGAFRFVNMVVRWLMLSDSNVYSEMLRRSDTMPSPVTTKTSEDAASSLLSYGFSCMQGWRRSMEDSHTAILTENGGFFAVYDGHSGQATAQFCGKHLYNYVTETPSFKLGKYAKALYEAFISIDLFLHKHQPRDRSGCTAVAVLIEGDEILCANAGDSRGVLCRGGEAVPLSFDHKPYSPTELARIEKAGGFVANRRVNGVLALSRAIGDFSFKCNTRVPWEEQAVTSAPDVKSLTIDKDRDEFVVIACDGIWDVMTNEQVVTMVRSLFSQGVALSTICEQLMHQCLSPHPFGLGCDNMSVIIVSFKSGEDCRTKLSSPVAAATSPDTASAGEAKRPNCNEGESSQAPHFDAAGIAGLVSQALSMLDDEPSQNPLKED